MKTVHSSVLLTYIICIHFAWVKFEGTTHYTRPSPDPDKDVHISTPDHFVRDFEVFVGASFQIAEVLDQKEYGSPILTNISP